MISIDDSRQTIVAIASSSAPAIRGVVRIAGESALQVLVAIAQSPLQLPSRPRRLAVSLPLDDPLGAIDAAALVWPTERSYSGVPSVEIHTVGSLPVLEAIVAAAVRAGARPARPGEFTMRAFLAGRIDLPQAEAVLGVIDARDRSHLDAALAQLAGNVSRPLQQLRGDLLDLLADLEAGLDFVDEDIEFIDDAALAERLGTAAQVVRQAIERMRSRHRGASKADIVLRGAPNAGKSSLLNALVGRAAAIVSDQAGTTRDVVSCETTIHGHPVRLLDTAGIEAADAEITRRSQEAARQSQQSALLTLWCAPQGSEVLTPPGELLDATVVIPVATKCDLTPSNHREGSGTGAAQVAWVASSAVTGAGLETLRRRIATELEARSEPGEFGVAATAARCGDSLHRAESAIAEALRMANIGGGHELVAAELRLALSAIAEVTGEVYTDDILDRVFSRFCIGK